MRRTVLFIAMSLDGYIADQAGGVGWLEGQEIVFLVSDTGVGIQPGKLASILDGTSESERGSNIGIYNTHMRLQYLYGESYGLHFESEYGHGTEVQVRIPAVEYQEKV